MFFRLLAKTRDKNSYRGVSPCKNNNTTTRYNNNNNNYY